MLFPNAPTSMSSTNRITATIVEGHGIASGKADDNRYPGGTIKAQLKHFLDRGLDLSIYFPGTINVDIQPHSYRIIHPKYFFEQVEWSAFIAPENFYFFDVECRMDNKTYKGLIYMPDPMTKEEHFQASSVLELLLPKVEDLQYGHSMIIETEQHQIQFINHE